MVQVLLFYSLLISITPGNLGLREGIIAFSAGFLGVGLEEALLVAIIDRAALVFSVFISGLYYSQVVMKNFGRFSSNEKSK